MLREGDDLMQGLSDQLQGFGIQQQQSGLSAQPSSFYGASKGPSSSSRFTSFPSSRQSNSSSNILKSGNNLVHRAQKSGLLLDEAVAAVDDEQDSTYEECSSDDESESEEFTEGGSMEQEEGVDMCIPAEEVVLLTQESQDLLDDGASDYCASDDGQGPDDVLQDLDDDLEGDSKTISLPPHQLHKKTKQGSIQKYCARAASMLANPAVQIQEWHGLPPNTQYWVCRMARFSKTENRWVDKGPVMMYFIAEENQPIRLYGNFLYGTKSVCLDLQIYELLEKRCKLLGGVYFVFSTFGNNATRHAEIRPEKVGGIADTTHSIPLFACQSVVSNVQECGSNVFSLKFLSQDLINRFIQVLGHHVEGVKRAEMMKRYNSFMQGTLVALKFSLPAKHIPIYATNSKFVEDMVRLGIQYAPAVDIPSNTVVEQVECSWCKVKMGPFTDLPDLVSVRGQAHLHGRWCPWAT